jgi:hypothetical protein
MMWLIGFSLSTKVLRRYDNNQRSNKYWELCQMIPALIQEIEIRQQINGSSTLVKIPKYHYPRTQPGGVLQQINTKQVYPP